MTSDAFESTYSLSSNVNVEDTAMQNFIDLKYSPQSGRETL